MTLDVRTYIVLCLAVATCSSVNTDIVVEMVLVAVLAALQIASGSGVFMPKLVLCYFAMVVVQYGLFPAVPEAVSMVFSLVVVNVRSFFPLVMSVVLLYKKTRLSQMTATFAKMGVPKSVTISLAVAIRYIPSIKEEWLHIRDAMRMRNLSTAARNPFAVIAQKAECYLVPLFVSALQEADELSNAAITRGIDNPATPSCRNYRPLQMRDRLAIALAVAAVVFCFINERFGGVPCLS